MLRLLDQLEIFYWRECRLLGEMGKSLDTNGP